MSVSPTRCVLFSAAGFDAGAGTGRFSQKLLSANALTHPGFFERVLFPLVVADGEIIDISDVNEKFTLEPLCPVEHNPEVHTAAYLDFHTVLYLDFQEARPAMSLCLSFPFVSGTFLVSLGRSLFLWSTHSPGFVFCEASMGSTTGFLTAIFSITVDAICCGEQCSPSSLGQSRRLVTWSSRCV